LIGDVEPNSPGARAGLQRGNVITELNGQPISGANDLRLKVATMTPRTTAHLKVLRNGEPRDVNVTLGQSPGQNAGTASGGSAQSSPMRGVQVDELTADVRQQLGLKSEVKGVVVTDVPGDSPAADAGLKRGHDRANQPGAGELCG
jgi:serine protease Do